MSRKLRVSDLVRIQLDPKDRCVTYGMRKYNGKTAIVSKVTNSKLVFGRTFPPQYELVGVESDKGVPYTFTRDMLIDLEE